MLAFGLELHQVDDIDHSHLELRQVLPDEVGGRQRLERRDIARAGHHDVRFSGIVAGPIPDPDAARAVHDRIVHRQVVERPLLARHDDIDVLAAAQTVIGDRKQAVRVGGQVDADDLGFLVHHEVDKAGVLVGETVVVLPPDVRGEQVVERGDWPPPGKPVRHLQPLRVLVEHRVDDVNESLVAVEQAMSPGEQVALQPALAEVLAQNLHHAAIRREMIVSRQDLGEPIAIGDIEHGAEPVRCGFIRAHQPEVVRVVADDVAEERPEHLGRLIERGPGLFDFDRIRAEVGQPQLLQQLAAIGMRIRAHPALPFGRKPCQFVDQRAIGVE